MSVPTTMKAWTQTESNSLSITEIPVPKPQANQVLVKVAYAAQNPTDWKHGNFLSLPGVINGCDFSGTVVSLGTHLASPLKVGDKVAGCVHGGWSKEEGSYAEYAIVESDLCFIVPESLKPEEAATFGVGWVTAAQTIVQRQGKAFPPADTKVSGHPWYIIYGASTSVGLFAVPLAKVLGYRVLGVCSPHSFDLVKSYGADAVIDYHHHEKAIEDALKITDGGVEYALDTISEGDSFKLVINMMGKKAKQLNAILSVPEEAKKINPSLKSEFTVMYTLFGKAFNFMPRESNKTPIPASKEDREFGVEIFKKTPELIVKYGLKPNPIEIKGGFGDVLEGLDDLKNGRVSGKKLVIKIA
ncbi:uncharacterized protein L203_104198 [Cryptococcus depauperatus CBS 7841]|uniref:Uncharacterized protein n=1 Tax=Cryptococcus depauperatus CBS 7841 TaxID=1295531 RepID=A0A1E3I7L2_9TREE|nr:dehydrogenase [Cryptococcus depauperatus CBS 7841]